MVNNYTRKRCFYGILYKYRIYDTDFISIKPNIWEIYGRPTIENYFFFVMRLDIIEYGWSPDQIAILYQV